MTCLINIPVKKGYEVDLVKPLKNLIESYYSSSDTQADFSVAIEQLNKLRQSCVSKNLDIKNEGSLELYQKYYDYITSLESKCPPSEIQIPFKWKNAFERGSGFLISTGTLTMSNIRYEKVCVLFNIAAIATQVSNLLRDNMKSDSFLKNSAKNYQLASGIFQGLRHLVRFVGQDLTWDLNPDLLNELSVIMLAQAQEIFFFKAYNDGKAASIIARVCKRCHELYNEAAGNLDTLSTEKEIFGQLVSMKQSAFAGLTEYFQSLVCGEQKKVGEEITRLDKAVEFLKDSEFKAGSSFSTSFADFLEKAKRAQEEKRKENDFIYHAIIPSYQSLTPVERVEIARPTPIPTTFLKNPDPFANLLPLSVQQAITKLDLRKGELVNSSIDQLREAIKNMNNSLTLMNLPASIEDNNSSRLPASLLEKSQSIKNNGGYLGLEAKLNKIPDLLVRNREILNETRKLIKDEEDTDRRLREQYGSGKYSVLESSKVNKYWKEQIDKYNTILDNAAAADSTVRGKLEEHRSKIVLLSKSENEIIDSLPNEVRGPSGYLKSEPAQKLRSLMREVEDLKAEAQQLEDELKNKTFDDIKSKFMEALADNGSINEEALSVESLGETYGPINKRIRDWISREDDLMCRVQVAYSDFSGLKNNSGSGNERDNFLSALANAHNNFEEITQNIEEGTNFYNDITKLLINLQNKVNDFCFARKTEREELVEYLDKGGVPSSTTTTSSTTSSTTNRPTTASSSSSAPPATQPTQPNPYQPPPQNMPFNQPYPTQPYSSMPYYGPYSNMGNPYYPPAPHGYYPGQYNPHQQPPPQGYPQPPNYPGYTPNQYPNYPQPPK